MLSTAKLITKKSNRSLNECGILVFVTAPTVHHDAQFAATSLPPPAVVHHAQPLAHALQSPIDILDTLAQEAATHDGQNQDCEPVPPFHQAPQAFKLHAQLVHQVPQAAAAPVPLGTPLAPTTLLEPLFLTVPELVRVHFTNILYHAVTRIPQASTVRLL